MFVIEKNIPLPVKGVTRSQAEIDVRKMEIGDSFFISFPEYKGLSYNSHYKAAIRIKEWKFASRQTLENGNLKGWRVWRIA